MKEENPRLGEDRSVSYRYKRNLQFGEFQVFGEIFKAERGVKYMLRGGTALSHLILVKL